MKKIIILAALLGLTACATNRGLYDWGGYDALLYESYKDPAGVPKNMQALAAHIGALEKGGQRVAPGLHADLGTMLLQAGDKDGALSNFRRERELWPESAVVMDAMIKNLEAKKGAQS
ncbi:DUF4810 domain-containing protein [Telluria sp. B2]